MPNNLINLCTVGRFVCLAQGKTFQVLQTFRERFLFMNHFAQLVISKSSRRKNNLQQIRLFLLSKFVIAGMMDAKAERKHFHVLRWRIPERLADNQSSTFVLRSRSLRLKWDNVELWHAAFVCHVRCWFHWVVKFSAFTVELWNSLNFVMNFVLLSCWCLLKICSIFAPVERSQQKQERFQAQLIRFRVDSFCLHHTNSWWQ